jgi:hypothetical protein
MLLPFVPENNFDGAECDIQLVIWPRDCVCDRDWLLEHVEGAVGLLVMLTDKANYTIAT